MALTLVRNNEFAQQIKNQLPDKSQGRIVGEKFCECLGGYAACDLLRKIFLRLSGHN